MVCTCNVLFKQLVLDETMAKNKSKSNCLVKALKVRKVLQGYTGGVIFLVCVSPGYQGIRQLNINEDWEGG